MSSITKHGTCCTRKSNNITCLNSKSHTHFLEGIGHYVGFRQFRHSPEASLVFLIPQKGLEMIVVNVTLRQLETKFQLLLQTISAAQYSMNTPSFSYQKLPNLSEVVSYALENVRWVDDSVNLS